MNFLGPDRCLAQDPATRAYLERRTAEGRTKLEITRCSKRYVTRQIHLTLTGGFNWLAQHR